MSNNDYIVAGNKIYQRCGICGQLVQTNKFLLGGLHICLSDDEIVERIRQQQKPQLTHTYLSDVLLGKFIQDKDDD